MNTDYERYYSGRTSINTYGDSGIGKKDTLARYNFDTKDAEGHKVEEQMTKEETLQAMREISSQYEENVIVEFSGDGMAKLMEGRKGYLDRPLTEEEAARQAERQAAFDSAVVHKENTHRMVIPNIQTNEKLYNSLSGVDEKVVSAANGIIKNYLLPSDVAGMSEDERKDMIAFGLEEAKYLAENYLDEKQADEFLSAMETIAKYGVNGTVADDGKVTYNIESGLNAAGSIGDMNILKEKAPDLYKEIDDLNQSIINHTDGEKHGAKFIELHKKAATILNSVDSNGKTISENAVDEYKKWEEKVEKTELPVTFQNVKYTNLQTFFESLNNQSSFLSNKWIRNNAVNFMKWLNA